MSLWRLIAGKPSVPKRSTSCQFKEMTLTKKIISTKNAPKFNAPLRYDTKFILDHINFNLFFSQAVTLDNTVYVSGVLGVDKDTMRLVEGEFTIEVRQALRNLGAILQAANSSFEKVVKVTVFLSDLNDFTALNDVYKECKLEFS